MSDSRRHQRKVFVEMENLLTPDIMQKIGNAINIPSQIRETTKNKPIEFLFALEKWDQFNPGTFDQALVSIGGHILHTARQLEWLSNPSYTSHGTQSEPRTIKTFVQLLTNELTPKEWSLVSFSSDKGESKEMLKLCLDKEIIANDMVELCDSLELMKRRDLVAKVRNYQNEFQTMSKTEFREQLKREIEVGLEDEDQDWQVRLKNFVKKHNKDVSVILDQETEPIESVYVPLTIVKIKASKEKVGVESGISEIDFLRDMHQQVAHETVEVVDFDEIVSTCDPSENKLWCMIGSPGSGKSYLCKHFAYLYGTHSLSNFRYTISIPCRSEEWHKLEEARHEGQKVVDEELIVSWLALSMSTGAHWSQSLSQRLVRSDGEGLFIIIDGADEFTRKVPFQETLLCRLLGRRFLSLSTILITSRPAAWSEILYQHGSEFSIDYNFQVLGFSPENRDLYFEKRIETPDKLTAVHEMFIRHDEINQLSLVPVNASLFCALFNQSESILSETLSHLYTQLIVYIIRRQLSRMGLKEHSEVENISDFHPAIRECIHSIGLEANQGIFERELTSDKNIPLKIDDKSYDSERFGLMHSHFKVVGFGRRVKVWTFQHLTIQEFMAALSICDNSWRNQCYIIRYFTASTQYMSMYKIVIRFVCGILMRDAGCITPILCQHALPKPMSFSEVPMLHQLYYDTDLVDVSDWVEFAKSYMLLTTVISETNSNTISDHFSYFKEQFQFPLCLYFQFTFSPNEWHCFLQSLKYIREIQILLIQSGYVSATQFNSLLTCITSCYIGYLALLFVEEDFETIHSFTSLLSTATLPPNTKISIHLEYCDLSACLPSQRLLTGTNQFAGSLHLSESDMKQQMLLDLTNQFSLIDNLYFRPNPVYSHWSIIRQIVSKHQFRGLYMDDPKANVTVTPAILSGQSSLTELYVHQLKNTYELLPFLPHLTSLTLLTLFSDQPPSPSASLLNSLTLLISNSANSLRDLRLVHLHRVGFHSWSSFFSCVSSCTNLIVLGLLNTEFSSDEIGCWYGALSALRSLAYLFLADIPLQDSGMLVLCHSLSYHPALRKLCVAYCELSSVSCVPLMCLIQTLKYFRTLELSKPELSSPDPGQFQILTQTAEECSVKIELMD